jgi:hypothetical protein
MEEKEHIDPSIPPLPLQIKKEPNLSVRHAVCLRDEVIVI